MRSCARDVGSCAQDVGSCARDVGSCAQDVGFCRLSKGHHRSPLINDSIMGWLLVGYGW